MGMNGSHKKEELPDKQPLKITLSLKKIHYFVPLRSDKTEPDVIEVCAKSEILALSNIWFFTKVAYSRL